MSNRFLPPKTFASALSVSQEILRSSPLLRERGSCGAEAEQLVCAAFRKATEVQLSRFDLLLRGQDSFPQAAVEHLLNWSQLRAAGQPLQYLVGYQAFFEHEYAVGPGVLIPRPETEVLVDTVIRWFDGRGEKPSRGIEVGLGSGAISIELLSHWQELRVIASELSSEAILLALKNAQTLLGAHAAGMGRLEILAVENAAHVMEPFPKIQADFLVSNPPYLTRSPDEVDLDVETYEPHHALFAPEGDSLFFYRKIAIEADRLLKPHGVVFAELPHERALPIVELFEKSGWSTELVSDLNQRERVIIAKR